MAKASKLGDVFALAVGSSWTGIRINTDEQDDAMRAISGMCRQHGWVLRVWDKSRGLRGADIETAPKPKAGTPTGIAAMDQGKAAPKAILPTLRDFISEKGLKDESSGAVEELVPVILVVHNMSLCFSKDPEMNESLIAEVQRLLSDGKDKLKFLVGLMPSDAKLPSELAPLFKSISHRLPDIDELEEIASNVSIENQENTRETVVAAAKAALGLTRLQAEGVFAESVVKHARLDRKYIWAEKAKILNEEGLVEIHETDLTYAKIGGLHGFKEFNKRMLEKDELEDEDPEVRAKGVIAVGAPGVGKSVIAYATGNELDMPTVLVNPGNLMNKWVGGTEGNTRKLFDILERLAPCCAVIDEIGQLMKGDSAGGNSDVDSRMMGTFLQKMNDMTAPVYWFFTANDISGMHEAMLRAERIDAKIYVRLPDAAQRAEVWKIYIKRWFPSKVKGDPDPRHVSLDVNKTLERVKAMKRIDTTEVGHKLAATLMAHAPETRTATILLIKEINAGLAAAVKEYLVDDEGWTPAEIRACVRLARRLKLPLHQAALRVGHACMGDKGAKMLRRLESWAINDGALDSETGELFVPDSDDEDSGKTKSTTRRKVRPLKD